MINQIQSVKKLDIRNRVTENMRENCEWRSGHVLRETCLHQNRNGETKLT